MTVWLKRGAWLVVAVLALWGVTWLAVPPLLKWQGQKQLSELLGREVTIGEVDFRPWTLELSVRGFAVAGAAADATPLLHIERVHANLSISSVLRLAPVVQSLTVDSPALHFARLAQGQYDVDDVLARLTAEDDTPPPEDDGEPALFALHNLRLLNGSIRFDDQPVQRVHEVEALQVALPFLSSLPAEVELEVEPRLSFRLNGTPFDSGAQATPFAQTNEGALTLTVESLDLGPYLGYLPASLPVRVEGGTVSTQLTLDFSVPAQGARSATLRGSVQARDVTVNDVQGQPLLGWRGLTLDLGEVQPFARRAALESLRIEGAQVHMRRDAQGRLLLPQTGQRPTPKAPTPAVQAAAPASAASGANAAPAPSAWALSLGTLAFTDARIHWNDAAVSPAVALQLDAVTASAERLHWPMTQPVPLTLEGRLRPQAADSKPVGMLTLAGQAGAGSARIDLTLAGLELQALAPYVAQALTPTVNGQISARGTLDWSGERGAERLQLTLPEASAQSIALRDGNGRRDDASLDRLTLADVTVDVPARQVVIGRATLAKPYLSLALDAQGGLNLQQWAAADGDAPSTPTAAAADTAPTWHVQLRHLKLADGHLRWRDASLGETPLRLEADALNAELQGFVWPQAEGMAPAEWSLDARLGTPGIARDPSRPAGTLRWRGKMALQPLFAQGALRIVRVPVHAFTPYFAQQLPVALVRAEAGYRGDIALRAQPGGLHLKAKGDVLLGDVRIDTFAGAASDDGGDAGEGLMNWQSLVLGQMTLALAPGAQPAVDIAEVTLSDFYSRLVVTEDGHFNLQDIGRAQDEDSAPQTEGGAEPPAAPATAASTPAMAASAPAAADEPLPLDLRVGVTRFVNGRVDFADHFVKPNYSAALTELNGELGTLQSDSREMAPLTVRGRAAGTALLEITGQLNPMVRPPAMDIRARANDLELAPLSPYAGKYAGYAIERGKLSADVSYKIDADGRLEASNRIVINQLAFGERIESPSATQLPVQLAVALLKDRNGVIDINLPVSGSLEDPEFSLAGLIGRLVGQLLVKIVTSPFALLASLGGGDAEGADLRHIEFQPGFAALAEAQAQALDTVAKALTERPQLALTITGSADPVIEREATQQRILEERLLDERRREGLRAGRAASTEAPSAEERAALLRQLYRETDLPDKPRNRLGIARRLPPEEIEALLTKHVAVSDELMRDLALQRGLAVRDALLAKGLPGERIFLAAPKLHSAADGSEPWAPRVTLDLSVAK